MKNELFRLLAAALTIAVSISACSDKKTGETTSEVTETTLITEEETTTTETTIESTVETTTAETIGNQVYIYRVGEDGSKSLRGIERYDEQGKVIYQAACKNDKLESELFYDYEGDNLIKSQEKTYGQFNGDVTTDYTYSDGNLVSEIGHGSYVSDSSASYTSDIETIYTYDNGKLVEKKTTRIDHEADDYKTVERIEYVYDGDNVSTESHYKTSTNLDTEVLFFVISFEYDSEGRVINEINQMANSSNKAVISYEYDDNGLLVRCETDAENIGMNMVVEYQYDSEGRKTSLTTTTVDNGKTTVTVDEYEYL
ncbi:MAG: hypothetical protein J6U54_17880 [Clostridiales bacterium]|nr:hypothetical protein [Clostridiales bacterium]